MKKLPKALGWAQVVLAALFALELIYRYIHFKMYPEIYATLSAPWYVMLIPGAVSTAIVLAVLVLLRWIIKRRMDRNGL